MNTENTTDNTDTTTTTTVPQNMQKTHRALLAAVAAADAALSAARLDREAIERRARGCAGGADEMVAYATEAREALRIEAAASEVLRDLTRALNCLVDPR